MKQSKFFSLKARDFIKGFIMAVITAIAMGIYTSIDSGTFPPDAAGWKTMLLTGLGAGISYLIKNLFTNSNGAFMKKEPTIKPIDI